jgi:thiamine pyrophosphokinase
MNGCRENSKNSKNILIVSGGTLKDSFARQWIRGHSFYHVIACDKGMEFFYRNGMEPDLILGDFDSADACVLDYFSGKAVEMQRFPAEKDWTDTELALRQALEQEPGEIYILGATGGRLDHLFGNIGLLSMGLEAGVQIFLLDSRNRIRMIDRSMRLKKKEQFGKYLSLVPWEGPVRGVTLDGMKYPLENVLLTADTTLGISNEIMEDEACIRFDSGKLLVFETKD